MKSVVELIGKVLPKPAVPEAAQQVDVDRWASALKFEVAGDPGTKKQLAAMVTAAATFIRGIREGKAPFWLTFLGSSGAGKTYLAKRIWRWYAYSPYAQASIRENTIIYPGSWCFWPTLASDLLGNSGYGQVDDLRLEKLVVLDEIGAERDPAGHVRDCLARLLSARVGKWTVITSNKSLGEIQRDIDTRISSRMIRDGSLVVDVDLVDYHLR